MKQTAVEWQFEQFFNSFEKFNNGEYTFNEYLKRNLEIREQARAIEKEHIENAFDNGWKRANETKDKFYTTAEDYGFNYYNTTFKSE